MNDRKGISWLSLYLYAYLIVGTLILSNTSLGGEIPDEYKNNLMLFWGEKACIISVCGLALYNFLALFKEWPNAIHISYTYLGVIISAYYKDGVSIDNILNGIRFRQE